MPFTEWDDATVKDAVENFMAENGRLPIVTDFKKENGLPPHSVIKQRYKMNLCEWLDEKFPTYYEPVITRKQALQFAYRLLTGEAQEKIGELLEEYPVCRWSLENIIDGVDEFYRLNGRLLYEREFHKSNHLPDYGHILYKFKCGLQEWYRTFCAELYEKCGARKKPVRNYLEEFTEEYERIKPCSKDEFNQKRDSKKSCIAEVVMQKNNIKKWSELLSYCGLSVYHRKQATQITVIEVIVLDERLEELYSYVV